MWRTRRLLRANFLKILPYFCSLKAASYLNPQDLHLDRFLDGDLSFIFLFIWWRLVQVYQTQHYRHLDCTNEFGCYEVRDRGFLDIRRVWIGSEAFDVQMAPVSPSEPRSRICRHSVSVWPSQVRNYSPNT